MVPMNTVAVDTYLSEATGEVVDPVQAQVTEHQVQRVVSEGEELLIGDHFLCRHLWGWLGQRLWMHVERVGTKTLRH